MSQNDPDVLVIGGGIIGVCAAYFAARMGQRVSLLEQGEICSGCSRGNAGWLVPSHCIPLAAPGVLGKALKWMWSPDAPFSIKPRLDWDLLKWLVAFAGACKESRVRASIPVLKELTFASLALYEELCRTEGVNCSLCRNGSLMLFASTQGFDEAQRDARLLGEYGIASEVWNADQVIEREPAIVPTIAGGVYYPQDCHISPAEFVESLAKVAAGIGVECLPSTKVLRFRLSGGTVRAVETSVGDFNPRVVIVAAGVDSSAMVRGLGVSLPIQAGKGYSFSISSSTLCPTRPLLLGEAKVAVTPFGNNVRFGGTLELSGLDHSVNPERLMTIRDGASQYFLKGLPLRMDEQWSGMRPCTPDGLPVISAIPGISNVIVASGHAMLGVSLGPITGRLAAQLACEMAPDLDLRALHISRFSSMGF